MTKLPEAVESAIAMLDTEIVPRGAGAYVTLYGVEELRTAIAAAIEAEREAVAMEIWKRWYAHGFPADSSARAALADYAGEVVAAVKRQGGRS